MKIDSGTETVEHLISDQFGSEHALEPDVRRSVSSGPELRELSLMLRSLPAFFNVRNHPFSEAESAEVWTRDFIHESRIARESLLQSAHLCLRIVPHSYNSKIPGVDSSGVASLAETLSEAATICDAITGNGRVSFDAFVAFGNFIKRSLQHSSAARGLTQVYSGSTVVQLQESLQKVLDGLSSDKLSSDVRRIFVDFARLIDYLSAIEAALRADRPLKSTLGIFTLIHEEARSLQDLIDKRALRGGGGDLGSDVFDTLDSTAYAINMELRKVFGHELVGLSALRQAPFIYVKVEQAHGLLSNCFQQSTVTLAQVFDPNVDGQQLFHAFQNRLEQSMDLCKDLWRLLKFVRQAGQERDRYPTSSFKVRLNAFREGSLRYLMYKDWETYERFAEEVNKAHGAVELAPVLHRFDCYLETLLGQVRMRAVLVNQPLEFLADESLSPVNPLP